MDMFVDKWFAVVEFAQNPRIRFASKTTASAHWIAELFKKDIIIQLF